MPSGIQVISDNNTLQIDENYSNLRVVQQGTLNVIVRNTTVPGGSNSGGSLTVTGRTPMLFFGPNTSDTAIIIASRTQSGSSFTFKVYARSQTLSDGAVASIPYCVFDSVPSTSSGNFGLQIYKEDGKLAFDSSWKYLRISGVFQPTTEITSVSLPTASSFAMIDATWLYLQQISSSFSVVTGFGISIYGNNAYLRSVPISNTVSSFAPFPGRPLPRIVFADTSGF